MKTQRSKGRLDVSVAEEQKKSAHLLLASGKNLLLLHLAGPRPDVQRVQAYAAMARGWCTWHAGYAAEKEGRRLMNLTVSSDRPLGA